MISRTPLRAARGKRRATEVCRLIGVSPQAYCNYEKGRRLPSLPVAIKIARQLGRTVEELFGEIAQEDAA